MKTLGDKIRYYRNLNGWSQEDMAAILNIAGVSLSNMERNVTDINYSRLKQIADVFKITVSELTDLANKSAKIIELEETIKRQETEVMLELVVTRFPILCFESTKSSYFGE